MHAHPQHLRAPHAARRRLHSAMGFTLVESLFAMMIVGVVGVAALSAATQAMKNRRMLDDAQAGRELARVLMNEILSKKFAEPDGGFPPLGADGGEQVGMRHTLDDVDDYDRFTSPATGPLTDQHDVPLVGTEGWSWSVAVEPVELATLVPNAGLPVEQTVIKMITVQMVRDSRIVAEVRGFATQGMSELMDRGVVPGGTP